VPAATAGGSGVSGGWWDRSCSQAKNRMNARRGPLSWPRRSSVRGSYDTVATEQPLGMIFLKLLSRMIQLAHRMASSVNVPVGRTITTFCVDITCSTSYTVVMAKRNLTIQLDEATIRHAKIVAAHRGLSLSSLVAQQLNELAEADQRYERARAVALGALADASGGAAPSWRREELYDR
jgi:hypothetical protein